MSTECKCLNPERGGTKCPPQHIALCVRGRDRECYGECVPIPNNYSKFSIQFASWMQDIVKEKVTEHIIRSYGDNENVYRSFLMEAESPYFEDKDKASYDYKFGELRVRFSYSFNNNDPILR